MSLYRLPEKNIEHLLKHQWLLYRKSHIGQSWYITEKTIEKNVPLDLDRDVYVSDEDYYEEEFPDGVSSFQENPNFESLC